MKFVALVSGGKDSCFNILHCIKNGHELSALANLYPQGSGDEIDSFMYQTVGYQAVQHYGECLQVPLYRRPIRGTSILQTLEYTETKNDESEDLYNLLKDVTERHPDIQAVSVGAILSSFQRTRVENVCSRLGLICLAYLWQRSQDTLLDEIIGSGLDARIIKVAGIGLDERHLGKSLAQNRTDLHKLNKMYGLHLCGEGGEYETLVLDAPIFSCKLEVVESNVIKHSNDDVWYLSLRVEPRSKPSATTEFDLAFPPLLDDRAKSVADSLEITKLDDPQTAAIQAAVATKSLGDVKDDPKWGKVVRIVNLSLSLLELPPTMTFEAEVRALLDELQRRCAAQMKSTNDVAFVSLILRNMNDFSLANDIYKTYFTRPNPPARICIQADIADRVQLSVVLQEGSRAGLHVQSRSYWAPANIGPYSQAIIQNGIIYQAGQIGLLPASLMIASGAITQGTLSLQHLWRVLHAVGGSQWGSAVCYVSSAKNVRLAEKIWGCWHSIDVDDDDFYKVYTGPTSSSVVSASLLIAVVPGLPRGAEIEWSALGIHDSYLATPSQDDDDSEGESSFISPVSRAAVALGLHVMFGHYTIDIIGTDSWEDIACAIGAGFLVTSTVLASGPIPASARSTVEIIPTTNVFYRNQQVTYGAVVVSRSDKS